MGVSVVVRNSAVKRMLNPRPKILEIGEVICLIDQGKPTVAREELICFDSMLFNFVTSDAC